MNGDAGPYASITLGECIKGYSLSALEKAVCQYLTDNLRLEKVVIRKENNLEYLVVRLESKYPCSKTSRCLSLAGNREFIL